MSCDVDIEYHSYCLPFLSIWVYLGSSQESVDTFADNIQDDVYRD